MRFARFAPIPNILLGSMVACACGLLAAGRANAADSITAPVLIVIGQQDAIFCPDPPVLDCSVPAEVLASELPYYAAAASLTADVITGAGHDIALHPSADQSFAQINEWIRAN